MAAVESTMELKGFHLAAKRSHNVLDTHTALARACSLKGSHFCQVFGTLVQVPEKAEGVMELVPKSCQNCSAII